uniref:Uncharacterized protein n=1 Tax=Anguilla anguilla TaxID=7936 RepID=A0A0E9SEA3_ANGAN
MQTHNKNKLCSLIYCIKWLMHVYCVLLTQIYYYFFSLFS